MQNRFLGAFIALFLFPIALLAQTTPAEKQTLAPAVQQGQFEQRVVELTNAVRAKNGLPPLKRQENLQASARWMGADMARAGYFAHTDSQNRSIEPRIPDFGYTEYQAIGENLAGGQKTPEQTVTDWMNSPGHRANLLSPHFREIGVSYIAKSDSPLRRYWVQEFGSRFDTFPVVINGEALETTTVNVSLYIYGAGWAQQIRIRNEGELWSDWQSYRPEIAWELEPGRGERVVFVELRRGNVIRQAQDSIILQPLEAISAGNRLDKIADKAAAPSK